MKNFTDASFFRVFDRIVDRSNPGLKQSVWTIGDAACEHERHSFGGRTHHFTLEVVTLSRSGRRGWSLMVVKEYWWAQTFDQAIKIIRWARPSGGVKADILAWLRAEEQRLDTNDPHSPARR